MQCERVMQLLSALVDGEVTPNERTLLDLHLAKCAACAQWLDMLRRQDAALRDAFAPERVAVAALAGKVKARLARDTPARPRCSLLLVDDEESVLRPLSRFLQDEFEVHSALSADAAKFLMTQHRIDLVLSDLKMPQTSGVELLEWVRQHSPQTMRLLMTGAADL